ncbi:MAG TPA: cytochrome c [Chitinophagaceae bacterium]|nr:cytochrome c [Chitinophagaceae bacterium]
MKKNHRLLATASLALLLASCGSGTTENKEAPASQPAADSSKTTQSAAELDSTRGLGKFTNVQLTHPLDQGLVAKGKGIYELKCQSCHKLTTDKLVGPGWKDVTKRRKPEWIMNFVTNTDEMIDKDPHAQALLEECMVRMPNQHLSDDEARQVLEFMRNNDGDK